MSKRRKKSNNILVSLIVFVILCISGYFGKDYITGTNELARETSTNEVQITLSQSIENVEEVNLENDKLNIIFFYVGQADCTLIKLNDDVMLIDAGNNEDGKNVVSFLQAKNITHIDYLVGTHADEDHIGGLDDIINNLEIENVFIPTVGMNGKDYKNVVEACENKNIDLQNPTMGDTFSVSEAYFEIMSAMEEEGTSDNNSSLVIELTYKSTKYLFMGDAETEVENSRSWEKVDILKVGHHGSNSSSSEKFLNEVKPEYSIIEVGKDNQYNLPNDKAIKRLEECKSKVLRTDKANGIEVGSFWVTSGGNKIDIKEVNISLDGNE